MFRGARQQRGQGSIRQAKVYERVKNKTTGKYEVPKSKDEKRVVRIEWRGYGFALCPRGVNGVNQDTRVKVYGSGPTHKEAEANINANVAARQKEFNDLLVIGMEESALHDEFLMEEKFRKAKAMLQVIDRADVLEEALELGFQNPMPTISKFIQDWIDSPLSNSAKRGKDGYMSMFKIHIKVPFEYGQKAIGDYPMNMLTKTHMAVFDEALSRQRQVIDPDQDPIEALENPRLVTRDLVSPKYFYEIRNFLRMIFNVARGSDFAAWNDSIMKFNIPGEYKPDRKILRDAKEAVPIEAVEKFIQAAIELGDKPVLACIIMGLHGVRPAASRALNWATDWNENESMFFVHRQLQTDDGTDQFIPPKNGEKKWVPIADDYVELLKSCRDEDNDWLCFNNAKHRKYEWVTETPLNARVNKVSDLAGVKVTLMNLRSVYATEGIERGISDEILAAGMHHTTSQMIKKHYNKTRLKAVKEANNLILKRAK